MKWTKWIMFFAFFAGCTKVTDEAELFERKKQRLHSQFIESASKGQTVRFYRIKPDQHGQKVFYLFDRVVQHVEVPGVNQHPDNLGEETILLELTLKGSVSIGTASVEHQLTGNQYSCGGKGCEVEWMKKWRAENHRDPFADRKKKTGDRLKVMGVLADGRTVPLDYRLESEKIRPKPTDDTGTATMITNEDAKFWTDGFEFTITKNGPLKLKTRIREEILPSEKPSSAVMFDWPSRFTLEKNGSLTRSP